MKIKLKLAMSAAVAALSACGGDGGSDTSAAPAAPSTTDVSITVLDGALQNALVCLDANNNGSCDTSETQGKTDASGKVTLAVPTADVGKYPVLAMVGTDAVDADSGPVTSAYRLKAPADMAATVSPFTTLIERLAEKSGATTAQAEASLRSQLGLSASLFDNYSTAADKHAAIIASTLTQVAQNLGIAMAASVGQPDSAGGTISAADVAQEITNTQLDKLTSIKQMSGNTGTLTACAAGLGSAGCKTATAANAAYWATSPVENKLTLANIGTAVGVSKQIASAAVTAAPAIPVATAALKWFQFSDASNWYVSTNVASVDENTPVNGMTRFRQQRARNAAGTVTNWGYFGDPTVGDNLHWSGSAWVTCQQGFQSSRTVPDARGSSTGNLCDGVVSFSQRLAEVDISGKTLAEVVNSIKAYPYTDFAAYGTRYADWGPGGTAAEITAALGDAKFPAGSHIVYGAGLEQTAAPAYSAVETNLVAVAPADVAAGGDARLNSALACNLASTSGNAATLEDVVARSPGTPCIFNPGTLIGAGGVALSSGPRNESWGGTTVSLGGDLGSAPLGTASTATSYYTGNTRFRVGFAGGSSNAVTFYECQQRAINGSTRNCDAMGAGTYTITTLGDARVMTFSDVPGMFAFKGSDRAFIERAGKVYFGYKSKTIGYSMVRLDLTAGNALLQAYIAKGAVGLTTMAP